MEFFIHWDKNRLFRATTPADALAWVDALQRVQGAHARPSSPSGRDESRVDGDFSALDTSAVGVAVRSSSVGSASGGLALPCPLALPVRSRQGQLWCRWCLVM